MKKDLIGFAVSFSGLLIGCSVAVFISSRYSLNGIEQGLVGALLAGLGTYLPAWIWAKLSDR